MKINSSTELSYLAGFFDGEGCISILHNKRSRGWTFTCTVATAGGYMPTLFCLNFGGRLRVAQRKRGGHPITYWVVCHTKALNFLEIILPYLRLKKPQAEVAIKFQKKISASHIAGHIPHRLSGEEQILREADIILMKQLKEQSYQ